MKISPDQNTITLDDGTVLVKKASDCLCDGCYFHSANDGKCLSPGDADINCTESAGFAIFIKEAKND